MFKELAKTENKKEIGSLYSNLNSSKRGKKENFSGAFDLTTITLTTFITIR